MKINVFLTFFLICVLSSTFTQIFAQYDTKVVHIVMIWLKESGNQQHIENVIEATASLKDIPGVEEIRVGKSIPSDRLIVDDSFDIALYIVFDSNDDLERYLVHPKHVEVVKIILHPLAKKVLVYDFKDAGS